MKYIYITICAHKLSTLPISRSQTRTFSELIYSMIWTDPMTTEFGEVLDKVSDNKNSTGQLYTK